MRLILVLAAFFFLHSHTLGQPLLNGRLKAALKHETANSERTEDEILSLIVKASSEDCWDKLKAQGIQVNAELGDIATVRIRRSELPSLLGADGVLQLSLEPAMHATLDTLLVNIGAEAVHNGWGGVPAAYRGKGVIIGIIDTGIDFEHWHFRDPEDQSKSRILYLWNQWDLRGETPDGYNYGSEYNTKQIQDELSGATTDAIPYSDFDPTGRGGLGHGTHVAGIAAGNLGTAPEADIIGVSLSWEGTSIIDAVEYIVDKAIALEKPCVVNLSLGGSADLHDGTGLRAEAYKRLANKRKEGTVIVAAAGNSGDKRTHWGGFNLNQDSLFSYFYGNPIELFVAVPNAYLDSIEFRVGCDAVKLDWDERTFDEQEPIGQTEWIKVRDLMGKEQETPIYQQEELAGTAMLWAEPSGELHTELIIRIEDFSDINIDADPRQLTGLDLWRVVVRGSGKFHSWLMPVSRRLTGSFVRQVHDPEENGLPASDAYRGGSNDYSLLAPGVYKDVLCVGSYVNSHSYVNDRGDLRPEPENRYPARSLSAFSSRGPSLDGRILPDVCAPGQYVPSSKASRYNGWGDVMGERRDMIVFSGTSMAAPAVSGAVALYLEANPTATLDEVKTNFREQAATGEHTNSHGALPNSHWGWGMMDIYKVLSGGLPSSVSEFGAEKGLEIFPNPSSGLISINLPEGEHAQEIRLYDLAGRVQAQRLQVSDLSQLFIDKPGLYTLRVKTNKGSYTSRVLRR